MSATIAVPKKRANVSKTFKKGASKKTAKGKSASKDLSASFNKFKNFNGKVYEDHA